jgi:hypothetical protein
MAGLSLALAFTLSCSSDDDKVDSDTRACYMSTFSERPIGADAWCYSASTSNKGVDKRESFDIECRDEFEGSVLDNCPSGFKLKCSGICGLEPKTNFYFYGTFFEGKNCEEVLCEESDE